MKKIGLIGGMSWESSLVYYEIINQKVRELLGGFHSAKCILESVDFAQIEKLQHNNNWGALNALMAKSAKNLENAGAELIVLCTNTMHLCSEGIVQNTRIPFLHIADATGIKIKEAEIDNVLLLGTKFTMETNFFKTILLNQFGIHVQIPDSRARESIHQIIYQELVHGIINPESKQAYLGIIRDSLKKGVQGVILGCTEIPLLIHSGDVGIPIFDTTRIHAEAAVEIALME